MKINTKFFGLIEIDDKQILSFISPIIGFDNYKQYALLDSNYYIELTNHDNNNKQQIYYLQSLDDENVCFSIISPFFLEKDYSLDIMDLYYDDIKIDKRKIDDLLIFCIINTANENKTTVNLFAPIIINKENNYSSQVIQNNEKWEIKTTLEGKVGRV